MDRENLKFLFKEFLNSNIDLTKKTGAEWIKERKTTYDLYRDKYNPYRINQLTAILYVIVKARCLMTISLIH